MPSKKSLSKLSSRELFELAKAKEEQELLEERQRSKEILQGLRTERRKLIAAQRKALAKMDAQIAELTGAKGGGRQGNRRSGLSQQVLDILASADGPLSTVAIREELEKRGISVGNLGQTLAYLKRQGRIASPSRALYQAS